MDNLTVKKILEINLKKKYPCRWDLILDQYNDLLNMMDNKYRFHICNDLSICDTPKLSISSFRLKRKPPFYYWVSEDGYCYLQMYFETLVSNNEELFKKIFDNFK